MVNVPAQRISVHIFLLFSYYLQGLPRSLAVSRLQPINYSKFRSNYCQARNYHLPTNHKSLCTHETRAVKLHRTSSPLFPPQHIFNLLYLANYMGIKTD